MIVHRRVTIFNKGLLGGDFMFFIFTLKIGEMIQFDGSHICQMVGDKAPTTLPETNIPPESRPLEMEIFY